MSQSSKKTAKKLRRNEFAALIGYSPAWVSARIREGMPGGTGRQRTEAEIQPATAIPWLFKRERDLGKSERPAHPEQPGERLKAEQADRVAAENAIRRGELCVRVDVEQLILGAVTGLRCELDGIPGRLAGELTGLNPAEIRARLLEEIRRVETTYADRLGAFVLRPFACAEEADGNPQRKPQ